MRIRIIKNNIPNKIIENIKHVFFKFNFVNLIIVYILNG